MHAFAGSFCKQKSEIELTPLLHQSCKCDLQPDCTCCKQCFECLDYLYSECCSCVDMCPKPNVTIHELSRMSHREPLEGSIPTLFQVRQRQKISKQKNY